MPGVADLLQSLQAAGFAIGLGSSAPPENVEATLDKLGHRSLFSAVVTRADVRRGKPDPQVFLTAAARMRIPPQRCAVIEDSPLGIEAAHAAGAAGIGLASTGRTRASLAAADLVVDHLVELNPERIRDLILARIRKSDV
jgi:beta-phosphoglucomutase